MSSLPDLGALKDTNPIEQEFQAQKQLLENGLLCSCGNRVGKNGIQLFGVWKGVVPAGGRGINVGLLATRVYCSYDCPEQEKAQRTGLPVEVAGPQGKISGMAKVLAWKAAPINWIDGGTHEVSNRV